LAKAWAVSVHAFCIEEVSAVSVADRVRDLVAPICTDLGLDIYDVEHAGGTVRVTVDREGGVDLEALSVATRLISRELDHRDPVPGRYHLEVSSPGLERTLRTPAHYEGALGQTVSIRLLPSAAEGDARRVTGVVTAVDGDGVTVLVGEPSPQERHLPFAHIERARTTFAWGGQPKPGKGRSPGRPAGDAPASPEADAPDRAEEDVS
jgi:ribosome maturation factor RimP